MYGRELVWWFFLAEVMDILSTYYAITLLGLREVNPLANFVFKEFGIHEFMLFKITITLILIGLYGLSIKYSHKLRPSLERSLQIGNLGAWVVVVSNLFMITVTLSYF